MRKTIVPFLACLALCAAGAAALVATNARAQTARKPVMIALTTPAEAAPADKAAAAPALPQRIAERRGRMCKDLYAHEVGALAYLGAKFSLSPAQSALFERWKAVKLDIARRRQADCGQMGARGEAPSFTGRLAREQQRLEQRLANLKQERPALEAFYNSLNDAQKAQFARDGMMMRRQVMMGMLDRPHAPYMGMRGPGPMGPGMGPGMAPGGMDHGMGPGPGGMPPTP
jgi:hypothetical protein